MPDIKSRAQGISPSLRARNIGLLVDKTENIYESLAIISKRANQLAVDLKSELHNKLEEFASVSEAIEEVQENKEQIEISKFYEKLPNPAILATEQFVAGALEYRFKGQEDGEDEL